MFKFKNSNFKNVCQKSVGVFSLLRLVGSSLALARKPKENNAYVVRLEKNKGKGICFGNAAVGIIGSAIVVGSSAYICAAFAKKIVQVIV